MSPLPFPGIGEDYLNKLQLPTFIAEKQEKQLSH